MRFRRRQPRCAAPSSESTVNDRGRDSVSASSFRRAISGFAFRARWSSFIACRMRYLSPVRRLPSISDAGSARSICSRAAFHFPCGDLRRLARLSVLCPPASALREDMPQSGGQDGAPSASFVRRCASDSRRRVTLRPQSAAGNRRASACKYRPSENRARPECGERGQRWS